MFLASIILNRIEAGLVRKTCSIIDHFFSRYVDYLLQNLQKGTNLTSWPFYPSLQTTDA